MQYSRVVSALRNQSPDSVAKLFDAYGEQLFQYCWLTLRSSDAAMAAVRDTMIAARAHIGQLRDPALLTPWLYALARVECQHRTAFPQVAATMTPVPAGQPGAEARLVAWRAVMHLPSAEREALDLITRHGLSARDVGLITGLSTANADRLIGQAKASLQRALTEELTFGRKRPGLPVPDGLAPRRVVSAAKVYARLPSPVPPPAMREEILAFARDPEREGERELAATQVAALDHAGFPAPPGRAMIAPPDSAIAAEGTEHHRSGRHRRLAVGLLAAGVAAVAAFALWTTGLTLPGGTAAAYPAAAPAVASPSPPASTGPAPGARLNPQRTAKRTTQPSHVPPSPPTQVLNAGPPYLAAAQPPSRGRGPAPVPVPPSAPAPVPTSRNNPALAHPAPGPGLSGSQPYEASPSAPSAPSGSTSPSAPSTTPTSTPTHCPKPTPSASSTQTPAASPTAAPSSSPAPASANPSASPSATPSATSGSPSA